jgi:hypothetical protein
MAVPKGPVVERPMLPRACGCLAEFQVYAVDKYRAERQAKFQGTRCPACVAALEQANRKEVVPKAEAFARLPPGARLSFAKNADGTWAGTLDAGGASVTAAADGPPSLALTLARLWLSGRDG